VVIVVQNIQPNIIQFGILNDNVELTRAVLSCRVEGDVMTKVVCKDRSCIHNEASNNGCTYDGRVIVIIKGKCHVSEKTKRLSKKR